MSEESKELKVTLVGEKNRAFVAPLDPGQNPASQARRFLHDGSTEKHKDGSFTIYPASQIASVTVQAKGTGLGKGRDEVVPVPRS